MVGHQNSICERTCYFDLCCAGLSLRIDNSSLFVWKIEKFNFHYHGNITVSIVPFAKYEVIGSMEPITPVLATALL